ncbi:MAG: response regulator [Clostridiales bacterium]|nr:response regulator [Clostridiales bacterium]
MYHILIVDDEKIERRGIQFLLKQIDVEWDIEEAANGRDALERLKQKRFDIMLTDVKMPFMDGLQLIEEAVKVDPEMKTVIFSGYGEFEYARKALSFRVVDYMLKPVEPEAFEKLIKKIISQMESRQRTKKITEKGLSYVKEHALYGLLNGKSIEDVKKESGELVDIQEFEEIKCLLLLEFMGDFFNKAGVEFKDEILQVAGEDSLYLNLNPQQSVLLLKYDDVSDVKNMAQSVINYIKETYQEDCFIAIVNDIAESVNLEKAYNEAELLMEGRFYQPERKIYVSESTDMTGEESEHTNDDTLMKQIKQDIRMKDIAGLREHFGRLCDKYRNKTDFSQIYIKFVFSNLLKDIYSSMPKIDETQLNEEITQLYSVTDFKTIMDTVNNNIDRLEKSFGSSPSVLHREIETVKQYIYEHYSEELSVDALAQSVYMAPSYLSHVFKKETGQNISKFIKTYRMEKAREMLENTHNKIVNISYAVGYPNVSYFCQSFREYFGISPQKYRSQGEINEEDISLDQGSEITK